MPATEKRIACLAKLGEYLLSADEELAAIKEKACQWNAWFTLESVELAIQNIVTEFLQPDKLTTWIEQYKVTDSPKKLGIVTAGNIPLVGFHDFLCGFMSGHQVFLKLSSKDDVLLKHFIEKLIKCEPAFAQQVHIADSLKNCDAYIATGSNNTARYFEQYFAKYPHIIRRNRTSVAILEGNETEEELQLLAKDVFTYFGLGCRNVTQVCVPEHYSFPPLLEAFQSHEYYALHHKYKNNFDYYLAIYLLNNVPVLTNDSILLVQNDLPFSGVSVLHYRYYTDKADLATELQNSDDIQTLVGRGLTPFGQSQVPALNDYADGVDTMEFLEGL